MIKREKIALVGRILSAHAKGQLNAAKSKFYYNKNTLVEVISSTFISFTRALHICQLIGIPDPA